MSTLNSVRRPLQSRGSAAQKDWSVMVESLVLGTWGSEVFVDLKVRGVDFSMMSSWRRVGVSPCVHLWISNRMLPGIPMKNLLK